MCVSVSLQTKCAVSLPSGDRDESIMYPLPVVLPVPMLVLVLFVLKKVFTSVPFISVFWFFVFVLIKLNSLLASAAWATIREKRMSRSWWHLSRKSNKRRRRKEEGALLDLKTFRYLLFLLLPTCGALSLIHFNVYLVAEIHLTLTLTSLSLLT